MQKVNCIVSIGSKELQVTSQFTKSGADEGQSIHTDFIEMLQKHHTPTPSEIIQRFKFHSRSRKEGEFLRSGAEITN